MPSRKILLLILIVVSLTINLYFRLTTLFLPRFSGFAKQEVYSEIKNEIYKDVSQRYPEAATPTKLMLRDELFNLKVKEDAAGIKKAVRQKMQEMKDDIQDEQGWTYLIENDSYRWLRRVQNYLNTGKFGTRKVGNQEYDDLEFFPQGDKIEPLHLHFYIGVYVSKFLSLINNKLSLMHSVGLIPVLLSPFLILSIFLVSNLFGLSPWGGFLASLTLGLSPMVLFRTRFGWFDTDIYNLLMPVVIASVLAMAFKKRLKATRRAFILLGSFLMGLYSSLWSIWWLFFYILIMAFVFYELTVVFDDGDSTYKVRIKKAVADVFLFISGTYACVFLISGVDAVKNSFSEPLSYFFIREGITVDNFWPNISSYVAELARSDMEFIIAGTGGIVIFAVGLVGCLFILDRKVFSEFKERRFLLFVFLVWLLAASVLMYFGRRFVLFVIPPVAIFFSAVFDKLYGYLRNGKRGLALGSLVLFMASSLPLYNAYNLESEMIPMRDSWDKMLKYINKNTPKASVINAWWSEGDWIMSIAKRPTISDPHWQYNSVPYWFCRVLLASNEEEAFGILRMLDSGGALGFEELSKALKNDKYSALQIVNKMVLLKKADGAILLGKHIQDKDTSAKILKLIYEPKQPAHLLVHNKLVNYMPDISRVANWDFERLDLWQKVKRLNKAEFIKYAVSKYSYAEDKAESLRRILLFMNNNAAFEWMTPEDAIYSFHTDFSEYTADRSDEKTLFFDNGIMLDRDKLKAYFHSDITGKWIQPGHLMFITKDTVKENVMEEGDARYSVVVIQDNNDYKAFLCDRPLLATVFFKLYFLNGRGLKYFELAHEEEKKDSAHIYLYKIDWNKER